MNKSQYRIMQGVVFIQSILCVILVYLGYVWPHQYIYSTGIVTLTAIGIGLQIWLRRRWINKREKAEEVARRLMGKPRIFEDVSGEIKSFHVKELRQQANSVVAANALGNMQGQAAADMRRYSDMLLGKIN